MSDPENKEQGKGFKGLQSLGSKAPQSAALPERKEKQPVLPPAWQESNSQKAAQPPPPTRSQTAASPLRGWVIGFGILGAVILFFVWVGTQSSSNNIYTPSTGANYSPMVSEQPATERPPGPTITMPPVGDGLVLTSDQIRYCVYEDRRIQAAGKVVNNYNQASVDIFNAMVEDYNSRCSHFRYREGMLAPIENEANQIQNQLELEGRDRMLGGEQDSSTAIQTGDQAAADAAQASADAAAQAADAAATSADMAAVTPGTDEADGAAAAAEAAADAADAASEKASAAGDTTDVSIASKLLRDGVFPSPNTSSERTDDDTYQASFDCARVESIPEYLICHDPELADDDRELALIYQRAKTTVADPVALTDRARKQWNYREKNCRDKSCLVAWFTYQKDIMRKIAQTGDVNAK